MRRLVVVLLSAAAWMRADVSGTVANRTTGKPQANATVTLYKLGSAGMESLASVKSGADGTFTIKQSADGAHLLQTAWDGVTYNQMLPPGRPRTGLTLDVYNASKKQPAEAKVDTHMVLVEPADGQLNISESIIFRNEGTVSFNDPDGGTLRIFVPESVTGRIAVRATAPQGMPIERAAQKTGEPGGYKIDFPIKPGETRFDLSYTMPMGAGGTLSGKVLHGGAAVRFVAPPGVTLTGDALQMLGREPKTQATVYELKSPSYTVQVEGSGSLRGPESDGEEEGGPGLQQIRPSIYDRFYPVLGLALLILLLGLLTLYRRQAPAPVQVKEPAAQKGKRKG